MSKKVVAVLFGGRSSEHEISKISASTIISNLNKDKYYVIPVYITKDGEWMIYDGPVENIANSQWEKYSTHAVLSPDTRHHGLLRIVGDKIKKINIDIVFPALHGKFGEDGTIQGLIEASGIPYVGCGVLSSALAMNKAYTKIIAEKLGVNQAKYVVVYRREIEKAGEEGLIAIAEEIENAVGYPCFVKPANAGSSIGVTRANERNELLNGLSLAAENDGTIIIEEFIDGRELECAVLGNDDAEASAVGEILAAADFYDYDAKYANKESKTIVPADIDEKISDEIRTRAVEIFKALEGRGLSRVDFFLEKDTNRVIFNEINTLPGFTSISMYPMLWKEKGVNISELLDRLIELGFDKDERREN